MPSKCFLEHFFRFGWSTIMYNMATNPDCQQKLIQEIDQVLGDKVSVNGCRETGSPPPLFFGGGGGGSDPQTAEGGTCPQMHVILDLNIYVYHLLIILWIKNLVSSGRLVSQYD